MEMNLMATLWPSFDHFEDSAFDYRLSGIRLNSAMMSLPELGHELKLAVQAMADGSVPLWYDIKGRQPRIEDISVRDRNLVLRLNHDVSVVTPTLVHFKAGEDRAVLDRIEDGGRTLVFQGGPFYNLVPGESLSIRHPSFRILDEVFTDAELVKVEQVKAAGFDKWFLSYVETQREVDKFRELVGPDAEVFLKIESMKGLRYVDRVFRKSDNTRLVAACGDLYVEITWPHLMDKALRLIIEKDPTACAGSRMMLSVGRDELGPKFGSSDEGGAVTEVVPGDPTRKLPPPRGETPDLADFLQVAWLMQAGYRTLLLCDEICLKGHLLERAVAATYAYIRDCDQPMDW